MPRIGSITQVRRAVIVLSLVFVVTLGVGATARALAPPLSPGVPQASGPQARGAYGRLPLHFEANQGQTDARVQFLARGPDSTLFLTATEAVLVLSRSAPQRPDKRARLAGEGPTLQDRPERQGPARTALRLTFVGANLNPHVIGHEALPGKANYFRGNDPTRWRTNVPTYAQVRYQHLYPGIDLVYYGTQRELEYDFIVAPGADPGRIVLAFQGAARLEVEAGGDLVLHTALGPIRQRKPVIYQEVDGVRQEIAGGYVLQSPQQASFQVAAYDHGRALVIDPVLVYSTYLGGSDFDAGSGITVGADGRAHITGRVHWADFPTTAGAVQPTYGGQGDAFVTKLTADGSALVYATYLGGSSADEGDSIAVDAAGRVYVVGFTGSADFPTTAGAVQTTYGGGLDAFVAKLSADGSALVYSTYLGGSGGDSGEGIAIGADGRAHITGGVHSADFPTTAGTVQPTFGGGLDAFVAKLTADGSALVYATYLGGSGDDDQGEGLAVDGQENTYVTGFTDSADFPTTAGAVQTTYGGGLDAFVAKLTADGSALVYATYLGGSGGEEGDSIAVDAAGRAYVIGDTESADFPTTAGAFQPTFGGGGFRDAFVTKLTADGSALVYATYLGGSGSDEGDGIAVDAAGRVYVVGFTGSADFPTTAGAFQPTFGGGFADAFVVALAPGAATAPGVNVSVAPEDESTGLTPVTVTFSEVTLYSEGIQRAGIAQGL